MNTVIEAEIILFVGTWDKNMYFINVYFIINQVHDNYYSQCTRIKLFQILNYHLILVISAVRGHVRIWISNTRD